MRTTRVMAIAAVIAGCCAILGAQLKVGDKAPPVKVDKILHPKMKSMTEVKGRLVLYEYFAFW